MDLTKEQYVIGFEKSLGNALTLIEDAGLLLNKGILGHSVALSMLAIEERGRAIFLAAMHEGQTALDKELQASQSGVSREGLSINGGVGEAK